MSKQIRKLAPIRCTAWLARFDRLLLACTNASFECGQHDGTAKEYQLALDESNACKKRLRAYVTRLRANAKVSDHADSERGA